MRVTSKGIVNGIIQDKYGKRGEQFSKSGIPTYSLPFKIENEPGMAVSYALILEDKDAIPVCGFSWIHWLAANITELEIEENVSKDTVEFVQGLNSWAKEFEEYDENDREGKSTYGGMTPPDKPHIYELHMYALNTILNIQDGFTLKELEEKMSGHILEEYTLKGQYNN